MKFARFVFIGGGVWGIAALVPFYWLVDISGRLLRRTRGLSAVLLGFFFRRARLAVCVPVDRVEPREIPALDAAGHRREVWLHRHSGGAARPRTDPLADAAAAIPDGLVGLLFIAAFAATRSDAHPTLPAMAQRHGVSA